MADRDTWTIWYCLVAFGVVTSLALWGLAGIHLLFTIWITIPAFFLGGNLVMKRWMSSVEERARIATTPIAHKEIPGFGTLRQLPDRWELDLEVRDSADNVDFGGDWMIRMSVSK